ncbi:hypothetical protein SHIRM173S_01263 [Streptomyces hirsutus]
MKIYFLIHNAYGIGGTITATFNFAAVLAERHDVEIVSVLRHREHPNLTPHPDVRLRPLVDLGTRRAAPGTEAGQGVPGGRVPLPPVQRVDGSADRRMPGVHRRRRGHRDPAGVRTCTSRSRPLSTSHASARSASPWTTIRPGCVPRCAVPTAASTCSPPSRRRTPTPTGARRGCPVCVRGPPERRPRPRAARRGRHRQGDRRGRPAGPGQALRPDRQGVRPGRGRPIRAGSCAFTAKARNSPRCAA